jgi:hypothetical protein
MGFEGVWHSRIVLKIDSRKLPRKMPLKAFKDHYS